MFELVIVKRSTLDFPHGDSADVPRGQRGALWMGRSRPEFVLRNTESGETYYHTISTYSMKRDDLLMLLNLNKVPESMAF